MDHLRKEQLKNLLLVHGHEYHYGVAGVQETDKLRAERNAAVGLLAFVACEVADKRLGLSGLANVVEEVITTIPLYIATVAIGNRYLMSRGIIDQHSKP